jgi:heme-degrading monooxygenase HmoA
MNNQTEKVPFLNQIGLPAGTSVKYMKREKLPMFTRNVSMRLKPNSAQDFTRTFESEVLPILRKQNGFKDEITLVQGPEAIGISFWEKREHAEAYERSAYPQVLKALEKVVEGTPKVQTYEVSNSTFHEIAAK